MKKLLLIIALTILGLGLNAQKGGGCVEYIIDFNDYKTGTQCLNGQDNWLTHYQTASISADFDVDYTGDGLLSPDESVAVFYPYGGAGVGRTATRKASENFGFNFKNGGIIDLEFDMLSCWWGAYVGVGFDADGDGHILQGMTEGDGGIYLRVAGSGNENHPNILLPNGKNVSIANYQQTNWARYKMSFDFSAFDGAGSLTVFVKDFDGTNWSEWTQLAEATELNMGLTPGSGDMRDYQVWDGIFMHSNGACGAFDNLLVRQGSCVPENLVATSVSTSSIILTWDNVENAISYNVYRDNDLIANVKYTEYTDTDLEIYTEYCYTVTAVCNESESNKSEEVCATTFDLPIMAPQNINANVLSTSSIILTWDLVDNALSYNVYDGDIMIYNVTANVCAINNLKSDTEYCYTVTAVCNESESDKSEEVCATTFNLPIMAPQNINANVLSTSSIILTWDNVENALSYNVYRDGDSIANVTNPTYTDKDLEYNTEYCYIVTAIRGDEESEKSSAACATTMKADDDGSGDGSDDGNDDGNDNPTDTIVPEPEVLAIPENLVVTPVSTSSIILTWDIVENAESYNVYRDGEMITNVTNTNYTDKDLEYNTEYCYTVTAVGDDDVESEESEEVCVKTLGESIEELSSAINIYPNPVENDLFIATEMNVKEVAIYDVYSRLCRRDASNASTSNASTSNSMDTFNVSVQDLEAGVYFVNIKTENDRIVKRFVKK